jgi:hypothetical protein
MEYQAYMETIQANKNDEVDDLRQQLNLLLAQQLGQGTRVSQQSALTNGTNGKPERTPEQIQVAKDNMAKARAGRKNKSTAIH